MYLNYHSSVDASKNTTFIFYFFFHSLCYCILMFSMKYIKIEASVVNACMQLFNFYCRMKDLNYFFYEQNVIMTIIFLNSRLVYGTPLTLTFSWNFDRETKKKTASHNWTFDIKHSKIIRHPSNFFL